MNNKFIFLDENFFNNAIQVFGRYKQVKNALNVNYKVYKNDKLIRDDNVSSDSPENASKAIAEKMMVVIDQQK